MSELKSYSKHEELKNPQEAEEDQGIDIDLEKPLMFADYVLYRKRFDELQITMVDLTQHYSRCLLKIEAKDEAQRATLIKAAGGGEDGGQKLILAALVYVSKAKHDAMIEKYGDDRLQCVTVMKLLTPQQLLSAFNDMSFYVFPASRSPSDDIKLKIYWFRPVPYKSLVTSDDGSKAHQTHLLDILTLNKVVA